MICHDALDAGGAGGQLRKGRNPWAYHLRRRSRYLGICSKTQGELMN
jgi:hypothetical protein